MLDIFFVGLYIWLGCVSLSVVVILLESFGIDVWFGFFDSTQDLDGEEDE